MTEKRSGLTAAGIKNYAMVFMLFDHVTCAFVQYGMWLLRDYSIPVVPYLALRSVGRLSFPLYCFFIAEGFRHTRSAKKYLLRLLLFGLVSEVFFDRALFGTWVTWEHQNVYFTLALGLLSLMGWTRLLGGSFREASLPRKLGAAAWVALCIAGGLALKTDYDGPGVACVFLMFLLSDRPRGRDLAVTGVLTASSFLEIFCVPYWFLLRAYNGERGRGNKLLFYLFYPGHLALLVLLRYLILGV